MVQQSSKQPTRRAASSPIVENTDFVMSAPARVISSSKTRYAMVAEAAYYISQRRGAAPGSALADWLVAESEINQRLS